MDGGQALVLDTKEAYHVLKTTEIVGWWLSADCLRQGPSQVLVTFTTGSQ